MSATHRIWLRSACVAAVCLAGVATIGAQESWDGKSGASTWGGAPAAKGSSASGHAASTGSSSSWIAGRSSSAPTAAPGGVWTDTAGMPASGGKADVNERGGSSAASGKSAAPAGPGASSGVSHLKTAAVAPGRTQSVNSSALLRSGAHHNAKGSMLPRLARGNTLALGSKSGSHGHGKLNFSANTANPIAAKKPGSSAANEPSHPEETPGDLSQPTGRLPESIRDR